MADTQEDTPIQVKTCANDIYDKNTATAVQFVAGSFSSEKRNPIVSKCHKICRKTSLLRFHLLTEQVHRGRAEQSDSLNETPIFYSLKASSFQQ